MQQWPAPSMWQGNCFFFLIGIAQQEAPTAVGGTMKTNSIQFIYLAINAIATGKYCAEIEELLSDAIEQKLLAVNEQAQAA